MAHVNNKGTDQPAHLPILISAFVIRCLDSVMPIDFIFKVSRLCLVSVAEQVSLSLTGSNPQRRFSRDVALSFG